MIGHLRVKSPWSQLAIFLGLLGASFIIASLMMVGMAAMNGLPLTGLDQMDWSDSRIVATMKWIQALSSLVIFLLPSFVFALIVFNGRPFYFLGFRRAGRPNLYLLASLCMLLAFPLVFWLGEINQLIPLPEWMNAFEKDATKQMEAFLKADGFADVLINIIVIALLPAICEEIAFRGVLQRIFIAVFRNPWGGIIFAAFLFSAFHLQFQGFLPRMFLGVLLGVMYWYSGSLWTSILAHFVYNGVQVGVVSYAPKYVSQNPSVPFFAALISAAAVGVIVWIFRKRSTVTYAAEYETDELNKHNQFIA